MAAAAGLSVPPTSAGIRWPFRHFPLGLCTYRVRFVSDHNRPRVGRPRIDHLTRAVCALTNNEEVRESRRGKYSRGDGAANILVMLSSLESRFIGHL